ncbi:type IV toxin-antitoxin system AbiEi family antitoxin domain-containing protein [Streptomyces sp. NPDC051976]|uniref:type IV toxin-antitoxin system AbiEi family antitoxin domain-containing protein n=1 Tax=Streptomyces sp. NPDC051976 TaxID=3154947 RepID=UPI003413BAAF
MDRGEQLGLLGGVASDQWGLVTTAQAKAAGLNSVQLRRLAEAGLIEVVGRGVYLLAAAGQPQHLEIKVAWLRLQPSVPAWARERGGPDSGVISHASACQVHGLGDVPAPTVEISVPRRRTTTDRFVHLRIAPLDPSDIVIIDGLPVTSVTRTIVDLLQAKTDGGHVGAVIADADHRGSISLDELAGRVQPYARGYGLPADTDGRTLLEHLVQQAGGVLRAQEIERAAQQGFDRAVQLLSPHLATTKGQENPSPANAAVLEAIRAMPASALQLQLSALSEALRSHGAWLHSPAAEALHAALASPLTGSTAAVAAALHNPLGSLGTQWAEAVAAALGTEPWRALQGPAAQPHPAITAALKGMRSTPLPPLPLEETPDTEPSGDDHDAAGTPRPVT